MVHRVYIAALVAILSLPNTATTTPPSPSTTCQASDIFDVGVGASIGINKCNKEYNSKSSQGTWNETMASGLVCEAACYKVLLMMMSDMANRNCDMPVDTLQRGLTNLASVGDMDGVDIPDMIQKMKDQNVTSISHADFVQGNKYFEDICTQRVIADGTTTTCAAEYRAVQDKDDKMHEYFCNSFSRSCSDLKAAVKEYAKAQPSFESLSQDFDFDKSDECTTLSIYEDDDGGHVSTTPTPRVPQTTDGDPSSTHKKSKGLGQGVIVLIAFLAVGIVGGVIFGTIWHVRKPNRYKPVEMYNFDDDDSGSKDGDDELLGNSLKMTDTMDSMIAKELADDSDA